MKKLAAVLMFLLFAIPASADLVLYQGSSLSMVSKPGADGEDGTGFAPCNPAISNCFDEYPANAAHVAAPASGFIRQYNYGGDIWVRNPTGGPIKVEEAGGAASLPTCSEGQALRVSGGEWTCSNALTNALARIAALETETILTFASISPSPSSWAAGSVEVATYAQQTITITSDGTEADTIGTVELTGTGSAQFSIHSNACAGSLAPASTCDIVLRYSPSAEGSHSASLSVPSSAPTSPLLVSLSGTGYQEDVLAFTDDFNRADGGLGGDWVTVLGAPVIYSNAVIGEERSLNIARLNTSTDINAATISADYARGAHLIQNGGVVFWLEDSANYWMALFYPEASALRIYQVDDGDMVMMAEGAFTIVANTVYSMTVTISGTSIVVDVGATAGVVSHTADAAGSGNVGIALWYPGPTVLCQVDNFSVQED